MWAPVLLLISLVSALIGFTGVMGEEVQTPARVSFVAFLALFFGATFFRTPHQDTPTTTSTP